MAKLTRAFGVLLAGTGVAHFAAPKLFEPVSAIAFPEDTRQWVYRNGATELALGAAITVQRTRKLGLIGLGAYVLWLASRAAR
ncbi:hypothetical protein GCM10010174_57950 [Kutzneria viridogrisea]|uniref:Membrane protein n=2 Tax=Kutzneria TaxID=43356 RepID=A0ABR6BKX2_9PSEU|nr:hypothetical protein [Kutzneria albida]AHH95284.1 putative secreted protein [Kutzneria albida DSM 43870]MBA8927360.1 putative membrane protein [Kutzneria viridogrisea]